MTGFSLIRILGNDLPPRHAAGQALRNTGFILENEPELVDCSRHWIVNRIADQDLERSVLALLDRHRQSFLHIPFELEGYKRASKREKDGSSYHRVRYLTNVNEARNMALERLGNMDGWTLPLDGNCIFTSQGWELFVGATRVSESTNLLIPMYRLLSNEEYTGFRQTGKETHEPQVAFRTDRGMRFNERRIWGKGSKLELIRRVAGDDWIQPGNPLLAGYVLRLFSGVAAGEGHWTIRDELRNRAVKLKLAEIDSWFEH